MFAGPSAAVNLKVFEPLWKFPTWQQGTGNEITAHKTYYFIYYIIY